MEEGVPIEHRMVTRAIENAQKQVEGHNFDIRKHLLEYDDVMNKQRTLVYRLRQTIFSEPVAEQIQEAIEEIIAGDVDLYCPDKTYAEEWDLNGLSLALSSTFNRPFPTTGFSLEDRNLFKDQLLKEVLETYQKKKSEIGEEAFHKMECQILLRTIDSQWKDHLLAMDYLKEGVGLRGYGQKEPLSEYKREGFELFSDMIDRVWRGGVEHCFRVQVVKSEPKPPTPVRIPVMRLNRGEEPKAVTVHREEKKIGRNDPCSCGSGKKYKKCCGR